MRTYALHSLLNIIENLKGLYKYLLYDGTLLDLGGPRGPWPSKVLKKVNIFEIKGSTQLFRSAKKIKC